MSAAAAGPDGTGRTQLDLSRRSLFSKAAESYEGRPGYPERVYDLLGERCGLGPGTSVVEIGPGTGQATGPLLDRGATVTAVEIGAEFAALLRERYAGRPFQVEVGAFEAVGAALVAAGLRVDLVAAATSFHWVPTSSGLHLAAELLHPGGWLALWWNSFGDPRRVDPFHEALIPLLERLAPSLLDTPSSSSLNPSAPYATDAEERVADIDASGRFEPVHHELIEWTGHHTPAEVRRMFGSFSPWLALADDHREAVLDGLETIAHTEFGGTVERPYLTPIYLARRRGV